MRVYLAPCGIGLGHMGRCVPIANKLAQKNAQILFSTYREGVHYAKLENLPFVEAPAISFQVRSDGSVDFKKTAINPGPFYASFTFLKQLNYEIQTIKSFEPDVILSDSRLSPLLAGKILGKPTICILNQFQVIIPRTKRFLRLAKFADFYTLAVIGKLWTSGNALFIPDFPQPYTICAGNINISPSYRKKTELIGPILQTRPEELPTKKELRKKLKLPLDKPVIFVSISGQTKEKAFFTKILTKIFTNFPKTYEIVMSLGNPCVDQNPICVGSVNIYNWISNRFEYLKACDLVISRAGHGTLTQCVVYGKPSIVVPTPNHTEQLTNAKQAVHLGFARVIWQKNLTRDKLLQAIDRALTSESLEKVRKIQQAVKAYDGLETVVTAIIQKSVSLS